MKIRELFEEFPFQERQLKRAPATARGIRARSSKVRIAPDAERLGRGLYSAVYARQAKPHDVRKVSGEDDIDGTFYYLKAIRESGDTSNPYYPKIRSMRVYKDKDGNEVSYTVEMERLRNINELRQDEAIVMAKRMFQGDWMNELLGHPTGDDADVGSIVGALAIACDPDYSTETDLFDTIRDPLLLRAIRLIRHLAKEFAADIGDNNVMLRRTPYGPQLVITDPLA